jgi:AraC family transcriptional regulator of adaptative response / DNA-3-methyladenine glycosylase II
MGPEVRVWPDTSRTVARGLRLIADGALDGEGRLSGLASRLGVTERHLRRLFVKHLGASPVSVAQSRRIHFARRLLAETQLSVTDIALGSGFSSIRRFNDVFRQTYSTSPSLARSSRKSPSTDEVLLKLPFVSPYDWNSMMKFLAARAIPGVEEVESNAYRRSIERGGGATWFEVRRIRGENFLRLRLFETNAPDLLKLVERVKRLFDLECDVRRIEQHFRQDTLIGPCVRSHPGLRLPGAWDPFELSVRAVLGQQVSIKAASTLSGRVTLKFGERCSVGQHGVTRRFPTPDRLADANLGRIGIPNARATAIRRLAQAVEDQTLTFDGRLETEKVMAGLMAIPGIGPWTAQYIAMRALADPDALPIGDLGIRKALERNGNRVNDRTILAVSESWRPYRSYATLYLWRGLA